MSTIFFSTLRAVTPIISKIPYRLIIIAILVCIGWVFGNHLRGKMNELDSACEQISDQNKAIADMIRDMESLKQSNQITLQTLSDLEKKKTEIVEKVVIKKEIITKKVSAIEADTKLDDNQKALEKSTVYIDSLYATYCEIAEDKCQPSGTVK